MAFTIDTLYRRVSNTRLFTALLFALLGGCSGIGVSPDPTETFSSTHYTRYAWRSEPPSLTVGGKDKLQQKSPSIRAGVQEKMAELGYRLVDKADAEFLVEYLAATSYTDGQLARGGSNEDLYGSSVNRQVDGASIDNAYALGGSVETGEIVLVFVDAQTTNRLWRVQVSLVVENANRVDDSEVRKAVRRGLASLPAASPPTDSVSIRTANHNPL